ncbi:hypothetical protein QMO46_07475 [Microbacterium barkeri]|nr:hypothetical protein [Microbacterium barkeri]MDI6943334.1 hypothetical protein [Microbacterium barkeri]
MSDGGQHNTQGVPDENAEADTASGGAPEEPGEGDDFSEASDEEPSGE